MREELLYKNSAEVEIVTMKDLHFRLKVNALCKGKTVVEASELLGTSLKNIYVFMSENQITKKELPFMRRSYCESVKARRGRSKTNQTRQHGAHH